MCSSGLLIKNLENILEAYNCAISQTRSAADYDKITTEMSMEGHRCSKQQRWGVIFFFVPFQINFLPLGFSSPYVLDEILQ